MSNGPGDPDRQDFIRDIIRDDLAAGRHTLIVTRFPPEPNGYLHIGHVMSICLNFGVGQETNGRTFLRYDDTNPGKEKQEYVDAIERDVHWLGFDWGDRLTHASDYFDQLYEAAEQLIEMGLAQGGSTRIRFAKLRESSAMHPNAGGSSPNGSWSPA